MLDVSFISQQIYHTRTDVHVGRTRVCYGSDASIGRDKQYSYEDFLARLHAPGVLEAVVVTNTARRMLTGAPLLAHSDTPVILGAFRKHLSHCLKLFVNTS